MIATRVTAATACLLLAGCSSGLGATTPRSPTSPYTRTVAPPSASATRSTPSDEPPAIHIGPPSDAHLRSQPIGPADPAELRLAPGSSVPPADLTVVRGDVALVGCGDDQGVTYPAARVAGVWRVDGPLLHIDAADGPNVVSAITRQRGATVAWGASAVTATGTPLRWRRTYFPSGEVHRMFVERHQLVAITYTLSLQRLDHRLYATLRYVSQDDGRTWRRAGVAAPAPIYATAPHQRVRHCG